jgi:hypothetical protein
MGSDSIDLLAIALAELPSRYINAAAQPIPDFISPPFNQ